MSDAYTTDLVDAESTVFERVVDGTIGLSVATGLLALASLVGTPSLDTRIAGLTLPTTLGLAVLVVGVAVAAVGVASRLELVDTDPDATAGLFAGVGMGVVGLVVGAVAGLAAFGSGLAWVGTSLLAGVGMAVLTIGPREDVGSTFPPALVSLLVGSTFVSGLVDAGWQWAPASGNFSGGFTASGVVPLSVAFCVVLTAWAAAKARGGFGARGRELGAYVVVYLNAFAMLAAMLAIVAFVASKGAPYAFRGFGFVGHVPFVEWPFVTRPYIPLSDDISGILPAIVGTAWLVVGASLFAIPLGVGAAVFLTEYAEQGPFTQVVEITTNALWSTPSVVFGLFGAAFLIPRLGGDRSLLTGMLVLGFMLLPLVLITSREALKSVPDEYRDASAALGVTQWETIRSVVLPAALPGVITGVILGVGRIAGETAPLILVLGSKLNSTEATHVISGFRFVAHPPFVVNDALLADTTALPTQIWAIIAAGVSGSPEKGWATAFVLLVVVLTFYALGIASRTYFRRKLDHE
ncbi:MAG: phosphate ABC transporter permease PstA [Haloarculaceae archaeon]